MSPTRPTETVALALAAPRRVLRRAVGTVIVVSMMAGTGVGCAGRGEAIDEQANALTPGGLAGPVVISGTPKADTAAFNSASRSLLKAQHGTIEDVAPKPHWRKIRNDRDIAQSRAMDAGDAEQNISPRESTAIGALGRDRRRAARGDAFDSTPPPTPAATHPAPLSADPELGPITSDRIIARAFAQSTPADSSPDALPGPLAGHLIDPPPDYARLPVTRLVLPDGRLRIIWHLRSFGGPKVAAGGVINGNTTRRQVTLSPTDLAPLVSVVQGQLADKGQVLPLPNENKLVITCHADLEREVLALLDEVDVPAPQVEITAKIFEVSHNFDYQQGARVLMNRLAEDGTQQVLSSFQTQRLLDAVATATPFQGSVVSLMQTFQEAGISLDASFELLAEAGLIHVVSSPRLTVAEGQTGYMLAGQELPIQSANIVNNVLTAQTQYKPVGVQLYITPQAIGDGLIKLHTVSIVSSVAGFSPLPTIRGSQQQNPLFLNPIIDSREAETAVTVAEGETLVISGMRMVRTITREDKVPGLGDIPLLGNLFKSHRSQQHMTDLYFFVTPTLASAAD